MIEQGALPAPGEVVIEKHLADFHQLKPGDRVRIPLPGERSVALVVSGVAVSAEYLWVARNRQDILPSPDEFGVVYVPRAQVASIAQEMLKAAFDAVPDDGAGAKAVPDDPVEVLAQLSLAADVHKGNQLLLDPAAGHTREDALAAARQVLPAERVLGTTPREKLLGIEMLQFDVDGFREMAGFFPLFFLVIGVFITMALIGRLVDEQRPLIGTMRALGASRSTILVHYLAFGVVLGMLGALVGAVLGTLGGRAMTRSYASELGIPHVTADPLWALSVAGLLLGITSASIAAYLPARAAARLAPAEAMRPPRPAGGRWLRALGSLFDALPLAMRLGARNVLRAPGRSFGTALGVAFALTIVLVSGEMLEGMSVAYTTQFERTQTYDFRVDLLRPKSAKVLLARGRALDGVVDAEVLRALPVRAMAEGTPGDATDARVETLLQGIDARPSMLVPSTFGGAQVVPGEREAVVSSNLATRLHLEVGETIVLRVPTRAAPLRFRVGALCDGIMGTAVYVRRSTLDELFDDDAVTTLLLRVDTADIDAVNDALRAWPDVIRVENVARFKALVDESLALSWVFLGFMLLLSVILASAILFNTATLAVLERAREIATLRALGLHMREVSVQVTVENAVIGAAGLLMGIPLSVVALDGMLRSFQSDLFALPFVFSGTTVAVACAGMLGVLWIAQRPGLSTIAKMNLAKSAQGRAE